MIDIHLHVLPGFDDGPDDWPTAVEMCRLAAKQGIREVVATPHFFRGIFPTPAVDDVREAAAELERLCKRSLVDDFRVHVGGDCHLHAEVLDSVAAGQAPTLNNSRYLLLELPDNSIPKRIRDVLFEMIVAGVTPIITHPERNEVLSRHPSLLYEIIRGGAYAQVTAQSFAGFFGERARRAAELMVTHNLVQIIASDGHDPERRPPLLAEAVGRVAELVGRDLADKMVNDVPRAVLDDKPIRFPEPTQPRREKRPLWQRVLGASSR